MDPFIIFEIITSSSIFIIVFTKFVIKYRAEVVACFRAPTPQNVETVVHEFDVEMGQIYPPTVTNS